MSKVQGEVYYCDCAKDVEDCLVNAYERGRIQDEPYGWLRSWTVSSSLCERRPSVRVDNLVFA